MASWRSALGCSGTSMSQGGTSHLLAHWRSASQSEGGKSALERVVARDASGQQQERVVPPGVAFAVGLHVVEAASTGKRAAQGHDEQVAEQMLPLALLTRVWQLRELRRELPQRCMIGVGPAIYR